MLSDETRDQLIRVAYFSICAIDKYSIDKYLKQMSFSYIVINSSVKRVACAPYFDKICQFIHSKHSFTIRHVIDVPTKHKFNQFKTCRLRIIHSSFSFLVVEETKYQSSSDSCKSINSSDNFSIELRLVS